jgi:hypothetical protein
MEKFTFSQKKNFSKNGDNYVKAGDQRNLKHPQLLVPPIQIKEKHPIQVGIDKLTTADFDQIWALFKTPLEITDISAFF